MVRIYYVIVTVNKALFFRSEFFWSAFSRSVFSGYVFSKSAGLRFLDTLTIQNVAEKPKKHHGHSHITCIFNGGHEIFTSSVLKGSQR